MLSTTSGASPTGCARGFAEVFGGSLDAARQFLDEAMEIFHEIDDERGHAWTHQNLAWVAFQAGDYEDAEVQLAEAHERFEELGDRNGMSWAAGLQAWVSYFLRRFDEAEELALSVEQSSRRWGDTWPTLMMQTLLANLRLWTGRVAEAEQLAERALNGFRDINDRYGLMQALAPLNRAHAPRWARRRTPSGASRRPSDWARATASCSAWRCRAPPAWPCTSAWPSRRSRSPSR